MHPKIHSFFDCPIQSRLQSVFKECILSTLNTKTDIMMLEKKSPNYHHRKYVENDEENINIDIGAHLQSV